MDEIRSSLIQLSGNATAFKVGEAIGSIVGLASWLLTFFLGAGAAGLTLAGAGVSGAVAGVSSLVISKEAITVVLSTGIAATLMLSSSSDAAVNNSEKKPSKGDSETVTTNKGNEVDVTPSKNHTTTTKNPGTTGPKNSSVDILDENGNVKTRRWFDDQGHAYRDVDMTNHGNPSTHPEWPHEHTWDWSSGNGVRK